MVFHISVNFIVVLVKSPYFPVAAQVAKLVVLAQVAVKVLVAIEVDVDVTVDVPYASLNLGAPDENPSGKLNPDCTVRGTHLSTVTFEGTASSSAVLTDLYPICNKSSLYN